MKYEYKIAPKQKALDRKIKTSIKKNAKNIGNVEAHKKGADRIRRLMDLEK